MSSRKREETRSIGITPPGRQLITTAWYMIFFPIRKVLQIPAAQESVDRVWYEMKNLTVRGKVDVVKRCTIQDNISSRRYIHRFVSPYALRRDTRTPWKMHRELSLRGDSAKDDAGSFAVSLNK